MSNNTIIFTGYTGLFVAPPRDAKEFVTIKFELPANVLVTSGEKDFEISVPWQHRTRMYDESRPAGGFDVYYVKSGDIVREMDWPMRRVRVDENTALGFYGCGGEFYLVYRGTKAGTWVTLETQTQVKLDRLQVQLYLIDIPLPALIEPVEKKTKENKLQETKSQEGKLRETNPQEAKPQETKSAEKKSAEKKPAEKRPKEAKPQETKHKEERPKKEKTKEKKIKEEKPKEKRHKETTATEKRPAEKKSKETKSTEKKTSEKKASVKRPTEERPAVEEPEKSTKRKRTSKR